MSTIHSSNTAPARTSTGKHGSKLVTLLLVFFSVLYSAPNHAATLTSQVNRNQVNANETINLTISYDKQVNSSSLDLSALSTDFEIIKVRPNSSSSVSIVNGQTTKLESTVWSIVLTPKRLGRLTVPAFALNSARSQAIPIVVQKASASTASNAPLSASVTVSPKTAYPAQQLIVEVELVAQNGVSNLQGPQLVLNGGYVEALDQQSFQRADNGVAKQIVRLKYAVFPEQAGDLVIPIMTFNAVKGGSRSFFGSQGQQVYARTQQQIITILDKPSDASKPWFPAENVEISAEWSGDKAKLKVGEPITRTIKISALGQQASVIPPISTPDSANYRSYQDKPQLTSQATNQGVIGSRTESEAIVPSAEGELTLPALRVDWWDNKSKQWRVATLPAETVSVAKADVSSANPIDLPSTDQQSSSEPVSISSETQQSKPPVIWQVLSAILAILCLIQTVLILRLRKTTGTDTAGIDKPTPAASEEQAWRTLQAALKKENAKELRQCVLNWGTAALPRQKVVTLTSLGQLSNKPNTQGLLSALDCHLYQGGEAPNKHELTKALVQLRNELSADKATDKPGSSLRPLYPTTS